MRPHRAGRQGFLQIPNLKDDPDTLLLTSIYEGEDFVSYYGVPIKSPKIVKGVLQVFHRTVLEPDTEWVDFLHTLAGQTAIAIDVSTLFRESPTLQLRN